jgi:hypothetical protein
MVQAGLMSLKETIGALALADHHAHAAHAREKSGPDFEQLITESGRPAPQGTTQFDSQLGFARDPAASGNYPDVTAA